MNILPWAWSQSESRFSRPGLTLFEIVAFRVVADEHLAKGGLHGLDVLAEVFAVFEVELVLAALFRGQEVE